MKKTKLISVIVLIAVLAIAMFATLVACKPTDDQGNSTQSGIESGEPPESGEPKPPEIPVIPPKPSDGDDDEDPKNPVVNLTPIQLFNKIIDSVEVPEQALNIDVEAKVDANDRVTTISLKGNFYSEIRNELCLAAYQQIKSQSTQKQLIFAIYIIGDKIYLDMADGSPLIYLSDFDFNYVLQIVQGAGGMLGDLLGNINLAGFTISDIFDIISPILFGTPQVTVNEDKSQNVKMELNIKTLLSAAGGLIGSFVQLPVDLEPIINYLADLIPDYPLYINAQFASDGSFGGVGLSGEPTDTKEKSFDFNVNFQLKDIADTDIGFPGDLADRTISEFSFTNIQFAIDLVAESVRDEEDVQKGLDLGNLINSFLGDATTFRIPEGLLLLKGGTGVRLSFKLDLDLNYDKLPQDNNKIAIELFLIHPDGTLAEFKPQIGIYYTEGSFYLNTDNMLPNYLNGLNVKLDASLSDLVDFLVNLVTDAIDGVFGLDFAGLRKSELTVNDNGSINLTSMSAVKKVLAASSAEVVALASEDDGSFKLSAGIGSFIDAIAGLLGLGGEDPHLFVDGASIKLVVNNNFFKTLGGLIPALKTISLPEEIGDIVLAINTSEAGLDSVTVNTTINNTSRVPGPGDSTVIVVDPALSVCLSIGDFLIGFEEPGFAEYVADRVGNGAGYLNSLNGVVDHILGGIRFSSGFEMSFNKGTYDLAPFIAGFGVPEVENSHILWTFDNDFVLDASLNLQISLNKNDTARSMIVLEIKTESGIKVGEHQIIQPNQVLLGIYGYNNNIYIDISNFSVAGIVLPKLSFSLNFTDLVYTLLNNMLGNLIPQIKEQGGDLKFQLDFKELLGVASQAVAQSAEGQSSVSSIATYAQTQELDIAQAIILAFDADKFVPSISLAAILALLSAANTDMGNTLAEALNLMEIDLTVELGRKDGFIFSITGNFIPKLDDNGESVYYFDESGQPIAKQEGIVYKNIKNRPVGEKTDPGVVYYTTKKYNYGSDMRIIFEAGTADHPVIVGNLGEHRYPIEEKSKEFEGFKSDLIDAIVSTVGRASIVLDIDLVTLDNEMNLTRLINGILANAGKKLELPISLDLDDWNAHVQLAISWDLDLSRSSNSKIALEMKYGQKNILALYIYRNSIIVDLTGLGLIKGEITNSSIVSKVFSMVDGLIKDIGNFDLNDIINDLLKNAGLPTVGASPEGTDKLALSEEVAADGNVATIGENLKINDFVKYLTEAIHLENTAIVINFTSAIINGMLDELVGINLGLNLAVDGNFDLFGDTIDLGLQVEDIFLDLSLGLSFGKPVDIPVDFDEVPDWDASSGKQFVSTLLNTLDIGFTIDLANYTNDVVNLHGETKYEYIDDYKMYTRIIIEKVVTSSGKKLVNVKGTPTAPYGSFVVTLAHINKALYLDNQSSAGKIKPLVYIWFEPPYKQLKLAICSNLVNFVVDIGDTVGIVNLGVDLVGQLAPIIDNLFSSIDGMFDTTGNSDKNDTQPAAEVSTYADETKAEEPKGLAKVFAELDIIKLLGERGVMLNLRANGTFNVTINFDPYLINKLIDDIFSQIFAGNSGHESIINLQTMVPGGMFSKSYLDMITWTRETYGTTRNNADGTFWGDFSAYLVDILKDVINNFVSGVSWMITDGLVSGVKKQVRQILSALLPFAVWNTATLEVNVTDATISNIHFRGQDNGEDIYVDNDPTKAIAYSKDKNARGSWKNASDAGTVGFFTEIFIYNSSQSVGTTTADGVNNGLVTWADIPANLTFVPYVYTSVQDGVDEIIKTHFEDKVAIYQKGNTIMRADVVFKIVDGSNQLDMNSPNLKMMVTRSIPAGKSANEFTIKAIANFSGGITKEMNVVVEAYGDGGGVDYIEDIEMHAYDDALPDFLTVVTKDGNSQKINMDYLTIINDWRPTTYKAHDVEALVAFKKAGMEPVAMTIHYLDSEIDKIIIDGMEGTKLNVNLYEFNIDASDENASKIEDYTPQTIYFKYPDGKAVGLDVLNGWNTEEAENNLFGRTLVDGYSTDVSGGSFTITAQVAAYDGRALQTVELIFEVKSKEVYSLTINGAVNTINIDPYKYYMYMIGESEENPFPDVVEANYLDSITKDEYDENVHVVWRKLDNVSFDWNNNNDKVNQVEVALDNNAYPNSSFTWTFGKTQVAVLRNEVEAIYFDEKLTQSALFIDPFQYLINDKGIKNFPDHAYVRFTNGAVYYMPIAWKGLEEFAIDPNKPAQFRQFEVVIGFDIDEYNRSGNITEYSEINGTLLQEMYVNVQVENRVPEGILLAGSELAGGTYYIDPVQVLYYGMQPFPNNVTVRYLNGKTSVLEVDDSLWKRDFEITLRGKKNLTATLRLNDRYAFDINVEIIDRSNLKSDLTQMSIDPYTYTTDERGNRIYDVYADTMNLYQLVGEIDLETFAIVGRKVASANISTEDKTFLRYVITYEQNGQTLTREESEMEYLKDFIAGNADSVTVISAEVFEYFSVPIVWNLSEINYSVADTYTVKVMPQAKNANFTSKEYKVQVEVKAKKVVEITGDILYIAVGGTGLSDTAIATQKLTLNRTVIFDDGTMGTYEITLDLTKFKYDTSTSATIRWSTDSEGNMIYTDLRNNIGATISYATAEKAEDVTAFIENCAMDIEVTVCSGDIAQTCTMKVHVLDNQMG